MNSEERSLHIAVKLKEDWPEIYDGIECLLDGPLEIQHKPVVPAPKRLNLFQRSLKKIKELFHGK